MARTKVARTRLTDEQYAKFETDAQEAGFANSSEYLRDLIVGRGDLEARVSSIESRLVHVEKSLAEFWAQEGRT